MIRLLALTGILGLLAGCQNTDGLAPVTARDNSAAIAVLQRVNAGAQDCWRKDPEFRAYRFIPELDTRMGKPRILVVEAKAAQGLPKLVIEAEGRPPRISQYGPLAQTPLYPRIEADVSRWSGGGSGCAA